jgi:hypothetical protein
MTPEEFEERYLPQPWGERDLQLLIQKRLRKFWILTAPDEVRVKTSVSRRIDIATWLTVYEVKRYLTREAIFHAAGQSEIYAHYGQRLFWVFRKKRVLIGLAPSDPQEYSAAVSVKKDFCNMGVKVIFINETGVNFPVPEIEIAFVILVLLVAIILGLSIGSYLLVSFL